MPERLHSGGDHRRRHRVLVRLADRKHGQRLVVCAVDAASGAGRRRAGRTRVVCVCACVRARARACVHEKQQPMSRQCTRGASSACRVAVGVATPFLHVAYPDAREPGHAGKYKGTSSRQQAAAAAGRQAGRQAHSSKRRAGRQAAARSSRNAHTTHNERTRVTRVTHHTLESVLALVELQLCGEVAEVSEAALHLPRERVAAHRPGHDVPDDED